MKFKEGDFILIPVGEYSNVEINHSVIDIKHIEPSLLKILSTDPVFAGLGRFYYTCKYLKAGKYMVEDRTYTSSVEDITYIPYTLLDNMGTVINNKLIKVLYL